MNKKKIIGIALIIVIFIGLGLTILYVFNELNNEHDIEIQNIETTDAKKFKTEYESLNDQEVSEGKKYRSVEISDNNPIKYATANDIANKIDNNESFIVYFGFDTCPWCRSIVEELVNTAMANNVSTIYYVDVKNIRDAYTLNENNEAVRTTEGTEGYYKLLEKLNNVLSDYAPLTVENKKNKKKTETVPVNEKRIYAPNVVLVKDGKAVLLTTGIPDTFKDPYAEIDDTTREYIKSEFNKLFKELQVTTTTTTTTSNSNVCGGPDNC